MTWNLMQNEERVTVIIIYNVSSVEPKRARAAIAGKIAVDQSLGVRLVNPRILRTELRIELRE